MDTHNRTYLIKEGTLELKYVPGKGAWTYHIQIPNTKHLVGKWGSLKVSGFIDHYPLESKNLFTIKGQDKLLSINDTIRKAISKSGGDLVTVTLYLLPTKQQITEKQILDTFKDSDVLQTFYALPKEEQQDILAHILSQKSEALQIKLLVESIEQWSTH